jgi:hypothetical protein
MEIQLRLCSIYCVSVVGLTEDISLVKSVLRGSRTSVCKHPNSKRNASSVISKQLPCLLDALDSAVGITGSSSNFPLNIMLLLYLAKL